MNKLVTWGNELYTGKRSYPFTSKHRLWFLIAGILVILSILVPVVKGGFNLGIDFTGGSEFTISSVAGDDAQVGQQALQFGQGQAVEFHGRFLGGHGCGRAGPETTKGPGTAKPL